MLLYKTQHAIQFFCTKHGNKIERKRLKFELMGSVTLNAVQKIKYGNLLNTWWMDRMVSYSLIV